MELGLDLAHLNLPLHRTESLVQFGLLLHVPVLEVRHRHRRLGPTLSLLLLSVVVQRAILLSRW